MKCDCQCHGKRVKPIRVWIAMENRGNVNLSEELFRFDIQSQEFVVLYDCNQVQVGQGVLVDVTFFGAN